LKVSGSALTPGIAFSVPSVVPILGYYGKPARGLGDEVMSLMCMLRGFYSTYATAKYELSQALWMADISRSQLLYHQVAKYPNP